MPIHTPHNPIHDDQAALWNGLAGHAWVDAQELLDRMFEPLGQALLQALPAGSALRVLDVGCGTGATTLAIAGRLGAQGRCTGIDISGPMLAAARDRAAREGSQAVFVQADAQAHAFEPGGFDTVVSRLGVMFFEDPQRAFANLRHAVREGGTLRCIAWRGAAENPFMTTAERAAAALLPKLPARRPDAPGQFAFADRDRVQRILAQSGWAGIEIRPVDFSCTLPEKALVSYLSRLGPLGLVLHEADEHTRERVIRAARAAFDPYVHGTEVRFTAACWLIEARASALPPAASGPARQAGSRGG